MAMALLSLAPMASMSTPSHDSGKPSNDIYTVEYGPMKTSTLYALATAFRLAAIPVGTYSTTLYISSHSPPLLCQPHG